MFDPDSVIVSAHFDDAVLCLGGALAASAHKPPVVTVCAGVPDGAALGPWDERAGFASGAEAARLRVLEDRAAAARLGFPVHHLPFFDAPYAPDPWPTDDLDAALREHLTGAQAVYLPAGVGGHVDHVRTRDATLRVAEAVGVTALYLYADLPYAMGSPHWSTDRFHDLGADDPVLAPLATMDARWVRGEPDYRSLSDAEWTAKRAAVLAYASQMAPLDQDFPGFMARSGPLLTEATWPLAWPQTSRGAVRVPPST